MKLAAKQLGYFVIFIAVGIIVTLVIRIFSESLETYVFWFKLIMGIVSVCMITFEIWRRLKSKSAKKKFFIYTSILIVEIISIQVVSYAFNLDTRNTLLGLIGGDIIFITIGVLLFDIANSIKEKREYVAFSLKAFVVFFALFCF
jgi:hypothetical protein